MPCALHGLLERCAHARHGLETPHAIRKGADAGQDDAVGFPHRVGIGREDDGRRDVEGRGCALERLLGRMEVARPVVDDRDAHAPSPSGKPITDGSVAGAIQRPEVVSDAAGDRIASGCRVKNNASASASRGAERRVRMV